MKKNIFGALTALFSIGMMIIICRCINAENEAEMCLFAALDIAMFICGIVAIIEDTIMADWISGWFEGEEDEL